MVKIERTQTAPASLAIESTKSYGSYNKPDVIEQLKTDFHNKCYICELKDLTDIQVEHLLPHHERSIPARVFDWNNLFYSCPHCNSMKNNRKYDDKIIDCCQVDPELLLEHIYSPEAVVVRALNDITNSNESLTADLIQSCFNKTDTGIRTVQCGERFKRLAKTMNDLYNTLEEWNKDRTSNKYLSALRAKLKRESEFAAFTRYYVRSHLSDYPELKDMVV